MDFVYIGAIVAFFVLMVAMANGCDKLGGRQ
jgi:NADH:ubiquinone oxidoreductase subunit 6 (subunit J)